MRLRIIGDTIVTGGLELVAIFSPSLSAVSRGEVEEMLRHYETETDADLRDRVFEQQDRIAELEAETEQLRERDVELAEIIDTRDRQLEEARRIVDDILKDLNRKIAENEH